MRAATAICVRELRSAFVTPAVWLASSVMLFAGGYFFINLLLLFNSELQRYYSLPLRVQSERPDLFDWVFASYLRVETVMVLLLSPFLAARAFSESPKGTLALLLSLPVSTAEIVLGKMSGAVICIVAVFLTAGVVPLIACLVLDPGLLPATLAGIGGIVLFAAGMAGMSVGVITLFRNQTAGAFAAAAGLLMLYVLHAPAERLRGTIKAALEYLSSGRQVEFWLGGSLHLGSAIYFLSLAAAGFILGWAALSERRRRGGTFGS